MDKMELIEVSVAAEILGVSYRTMLKIVKRDDFPATVRVGVFSGRESYRINKNKLLKWIDNGGVAN